MIHVTNAWENSHAGSGLATHEPLLRLLLNGGLRMVAAVGQDVLVTPPLVEACSTLEPSRRQKSERCAAFASLDWKYCIAACVDR